MANDATQLSFLNDNSKAEEQPVECLGMTFKNEDERREYFREELRKKLPELKKIEGFPLGEDEDIIALSNPPYYTACPNPWINKFTKKWEKNHQEIDTIQEPLSVDVSEGKNDPIYTAHTYHTKVPYKAIMKYMLHYTNPGDIVYDGFAGTGMTGVAAQMCQNEVLVKDIMGASFSGKAVGKRNAILIDLAPAATFIANNLSKKTLLPDTHRELQRVIDSLKSEYSWSVSTLGKVVEKETFNSEKEIKEFYINNQNDFGTINYVIWSECYLCSSCNNEFNYWEATVDEKEKKYKIKDLYCPHCNAKLVKRNLRKSYTYEYDKIAKEVIKFPKSVPIKINYTRNNKRKTKKPDWYDIEVLKIIKKSDNISNINKVLFGEGVETNRLIKDGIKYYHQVYTSKTVEILNRFLSLSQNTFLRNDAQFLLGSTISRLSKFNRYMPKHNRHVGPMANALYLPPLAAEINPISQLQLQLNKLLKAWSENQYSGNVISTQSSTTVSIEDNSVDYIFIDPPFGSNIMYSELSYVREAWMGVFTNNEKEAIENKVQNKSLNEYSNLMKESFKEAFRILKPNKWITIEFSNTSASVWNTLQSVVQSAGFIIASVDALDKKRGGFHGIITTTGVKQDLVISAYKPAIDTVNKMEIEKNTEKSAWIFMDQHLKKLPVFLGEKGNAKIIVERSPRILYDRMIAYHVQTNLPIPINALNFQKELAIRYPSRDGMVFLESQVIEYDKKRILAKEFSQLNLFVSDENSAIEWIRQQLMKKPQTRQDLQPQFMKELHTAKHERMPELDELLNQNFIRYDGENLVPSQILTYLRKNYKDLRRLEASDSKIIEKAKHRWYVPDPNKKIDLEKLREKSLLREYESYIKEIESSKRKLKAFRTEAIRAGFKKAYTEKDFESIVQVGKRIPETVIQEDDKLLMYYDNALIRMGL